jgi:hypothetical protein
MVQLLFVQQDYIIFQEDVQYVLVIKFTTKQRKLVYVQLEQHLGTTDARKIQQRLMLQTVELILILMEELVFAIMDFTILVTAVQHVHKGHTITV